MTISDSSPQVTDLAGFISSLKRRWWIPALIAVLAAGAGYSFASRQVTEYTAYSTVLVNPLGVQPTQTLASGAVDLEVEEELAASYVVAAATVELLDDLTGYVTDTDPARGLRRNIVVSGRGERVLEFSFTHADPVTARAVVEGYTAAYLDARLDLLAASKTEALTAVDQRAADLVLRLATVTEELGAVETARLEATAAATAAEEPIPPIDSHETALRFQQTQLFNRLADVEQDRSELESLSSRSGEVIGPAQLPDTPTTPGDIQIVIAGGVLGFLLGIALVWLLHRTSSRIDTADELLRRAGVPVVGAVQRPASIRAAATDDTAADYAFLATTALAQAEAFGLQAPLVLATTSVSNGDAAATTALCLGRALAASQRVLVVSVDLAHDELGLALGLEGHAGVAAYLQGTSISPHPLATNLDVLPAGRTSDAASLVRSPLLPQLFLELQQRYDVIVVTTPGLGTRPEAAAVTWLAGSVLLCLDPQRDTRDRFGRAVALLEELGTPVLGAATVSTGRRRGRTRAPAPSITPSTTATAPPADEQWPPADLAGGTSPIANPNRDDHHPAR